MSITPTIEFFEGIPEELANVSLRRDRATGARSVLMVFTQLNSLDRFRSFTTRFTGSLSLTDEEGTLAVAPSSTRFAFSGDEGDDFSRLEITFEVNREDHWERFMRFMHRYAESNGLTYREKVPDTSTP
jgi:photosystem II Psb28-2 protein